MTQLKYWAMAAASVLGVKAIVVESWQSVVELSLAFFVIGFVSYFEPRKVDSKLGDDLERTKEKLANLQDQLSKLKLKIGIRGDF